MQDLYHQQYESLEGKGYETPKLNSFRSNPRAEAPPPPPNATEARLRCRGHQDDIEDEILLGSIGFRACIGLRMRSF